MTTAPVASGTMVDLVRIWAGFPIVAGGAGSEAESGPGLGGCNAYDRPVSNQGPAHGFVSSSAAGRTLPAAGGVLLAGADDTDGRFTLIRTSVPPDDETPLHRHLEMDESFYLIKGSLVVTCGDDVFEAVTGDFAHLPMGIPHRYAAGPAGAEFLIHATPGGLEAFFDDWEAGMAMGELATTHGIEFVDS